MITRVTVLNKNGITAVLFSEVTDEEDYSVFTIIQIDPRNQNWHGGIYDTEENMEKFYEISLDSSKKNGWSIVLDSTIDDNELVDTDDSILDAEYISNE